MQIAKRRCVSHPEKDQESIFRMMKKIMKTTILSSQCDRLNRECSDQKLTFMKWTSRNFQMMFHHYTLYHGCLMT